MEQFLLLPSFVLVPRRSFLFTFSFLEPQAQTCPWDFACPAGTTLKGNATSIICAGATCTVEECCFSTQMRGLCDLCCFVRCSRLAFYFFGDFVTLKKYHFPLFFPRGRISRDSSVHLPQGLPLPQRHDAEGEHHRCCVSQRDLHCTRLLRQYLYMGLSWRLLRPFSQAGSCLAFFLSASGIVVRELVSPSIELACRPFKCILQLMGRNDMDRDVCISAAIWG